MILGLLVWYVLQVSMFWVVSLFLVQIIFSCFWPDMPCKFFCFGSFSVFGSTKSGFPVFGPRLFWSKSFFSVFGLICPARLSVLVVSLLLVKQNRLPYFWSNIFSSESCFPFFSWLKLISSLFLWFFWNAYFQNIDCWVVMMMMNFFAEWLTNEKL